MQLITMDVEETLENKTLQNGFVDNTKTGDIANGLSKISKKEDQNSALVENSKPLVPVQPDNGNSESIEDAKVSEASQDITEVLSSNDIESDILADKQNGESTIENKETEISLSDKDIDIQENKYNNEEEHKENNTVSSEILDDSKELKIAAPEDSLDEKALEDNNEDITKDKDIVINDSKTVTTDDTPIEEAIITENSATTDESSKTDELMIQQTDNADQPNTDVIDEISLENMHGDVSTEQETDINEYKTVTNDTNSTDKAIVAEKNVTSEESSKADELSTLDIENTVDQPNTGTDKVDAKSTVEGPRENETETKSLKDSLPEIEEAMETATTTEDETNQLLHNDIDSKKDDAMDAATTIGGDMEKFDTDFASESIKHSVFNNEEAIDTYSSINDGFNQCEETEEIKKLNNSQKECAMEINTTISNSNVESIEIKNIVVPGGEIAMETASPNKDEIKNPNAIEETIEKDISLVKEDAMVTEPTITDKVSDVESNKKSKITDPPEHDVNMEISENESIFPKKDLANSDTKEVSIPDKNIIEKTSDAKRESVENIDEEALLASPSHKTALTDNDDNCVPTKDMSADSADCVQIENTDKDINYELPDKLPTANVINSDKIYSNSEETGVKSTDDKNNKDENIPKEVEEQVKTRTTTKICGLSNTLDILSDDEDDMTEKLQPSIESDSKCINIEDDDDVMLIDDDSSSKESKSDDQPMVAEENEKIEDDADVQKSDDFADSEENKVESPLERELSDKTGEVIDIPEDIETEKIDIRETPIETVKAPKVQDKRPIIPPNFLKTLKTNVEKMTREELEEFCLLKIVEAVVDRTNLGDIKSRLKTMHQQMEEWKKKSAGLSKQNRDLQIVLKTVQEEQRKRTDGPITPLKITRSVGMQVYMAENLAFSSNRRKSHPPRVAKYPQAPTPSPKQNKPASASPQIPVPRLVPATNNSPAKNVRQSPQLQNSTISSNSGKTGSPMPNGLKSSPATKPVEKRPFSAVQSNVTVDLTDDEPPPKVAATTKNGPQQSVRMVPQQQLMARPQFNQNSNSPRKVYIPINSQNPPVIRAGQTLMLKTVPPPGPRLRGQAPMVRIPQNAGPRVPRLGNVPRHPAPLPDVPKQQQPPNWKSLPPAPDLKISKVENGIVISWKIDGFTEVNFEEIASYQLYAYQETSSPPNTLLWKKIGDVKALPLPMACTLTQFMAGFKYYFAVRAVDVRSRIGPFSLPGSILLLNNK